MNCLNPCSNWNPVKGKVSRSCFSLVPQVLEERKELHIHAWTTCYIRYKTVSMPFSLSVRRSTCASRNCVKLNIFLLFLNVNEPFVFKLHVSHKHIQQVTRQVSSHSGNVAANFDYHLRSARFEPLTVKLSLRFNPTLFWMGLE